MPKKTIVALITIIKLALVSSAYTTPPKAGNATKGRIIVLAKGFAIFFEILPLDKIWQDLIIT